MEEKSDASESDAADPDPFPEPVRAPLGVVRPSSVPSLARNRHVCRRRISSPAGLVILCLGLVAACGLATAPVRGDALERIRHSGRLHYGSDMEGGGPYAYPDPQSPRGVTGFEVELM